MDNKAKIERLKAIQEELAHVQAMHSKVVKLEEAASPMNLSNLLENDLEQAELILAAQDVMTRLQEMAEDLAKTSARDLFPLADRMKAAFGPEAAKAFETASTQALDSAMQTVRAAKDMLGTAILQIEGKIPGNDMAADAAPAADPMVGGMAAPTSDMANDDFAGADAAAGPLDEPLGRARKESVEATAPTLTENIDLRAAGRKLIESEGLQSLMNWVLNEAASAMPAADFVNFAKKVSAKASSDPEGTAGWIGKKRYGAAAMAQLSAPTMTANDGPEMAIAESTDLAERARFDDQEEDEGRDGKRKSKGRDVAIKQARSSKNTVEEGTLNELSNATLDSAAKNGKTEVARKTAQCKKGGNACMKVASSEIEGKKKEIAKKLSASMANVIEANIAKDGKGNAAKVVEAFATRFGGLMEAEGETITVGTLTDMFVEAYGMKPAAYSVMKLKEFMASQDEKQAGAALAAVADKMATDKNAANKPLASAMSGLSGQERNAVNKVVTNMKKDGNAPQKLGDLVNAASEMSDGVKEAAPVSKFARKPKA